MDAITHDGGMSRTTFSSAAAPDPVGPYSHAAAGGGSDLVYLSGQTPIDPATGELVGGGIEAQARQVFRNLRAVLDAAGLALDDVVKANVYLIDMADFAAVNAVYAETFSLPYPARTTVAVAGLPRGARVEIELVASRG